MVMSDTQRPPAKDRERGVTVLEVVFTLGLVGVTAAFASTSVSHWRARGRAEGAARLVMQQVRTARLLAARDRTNVALVFTNELDRGTRFRLHRDGNGNGVRASEAEQGVDPPVGPATSLTEWFPGAVFRIPVDLPGIEDGAAVLAGSEPLRLAGGGRVLSCTPLGAATAGTLYVTGPGGDAFAVRVLGTTGRLRLFVFKPDTARWEERW
jgi:type II secretory pathway pseudopilin PulG